MNPPLLIGLTGRKFNGKDTIGYHLCTKYGYIRFAFADALKEACRCIFGFTDDQLYGNKKEEVDTFWKTSPRIILQYLGTDLFRNQLQKIMPDLGQNIWVEVVRKKILDIWEKNPNQPIVVTDVRFPNEIDMVLSLGGTNIRVKRPELYKKVCLDLHSSELEIDNLNVSYEILNDSTLEELYNKTDNYLSSTDSNEIQ